MSEDEDCCIGYNSQSIQGAGYLKVFGSTIEISLWYMMTLMILAMLGQP